MGSQALSAFAVLLIDHPCHTTVQPWEINSDAWRGGTIKMGQAV
jgi:hypothetical protein